MLYYYYMYSSVSVNQRPSYWGSFRMRARALAPSCLPACCARVFPPQQFLLRAQRRSAQRSRAGRTTGHTAKAPAVDSKLWLGFSVYNVLLNCLCARYTCVCCRFPTGFNKYLCWVRLLGLYLCNIVTVRCGKNF